MDTETGENYIIDYETGEILTENSCDNETGEMENLKNVSNKRSTFRIKHNKNQKGIKKPITTRDLSPALIFLIPTLFIWPGIATIGMTLKIGC